MKIRKPTAIGLAATVVILGGGYAGGIMPLQGATSDLEAKVQSTDAAAQATLAKVPALKSQLNDISGDVDSLRALSAKVPAKLDMPTLLSMLNQVAASAGVKSVQDVTVTAPALVTNSSASASANASASSADGAATPAPAPSASAPAKSGASTAVIASYDVSMKVTGTLAQEMGFLKALHNATRLSVVRSTTITVDKQGVASMEVRATFFLQQVDVDGLAQSIEQLAKSVPASSASASSTATPTVRAAAKASASPSAPVPSPSATH